MKDILDFRIINNILLLNRKEILNLSPANRLQLCIPGVHGPLRHYVHVSVLEFHVLEKNCNRGFVTRLQNHKYNIPMTCLECCISSNNVFCSSMYKGSHSPLLRIICVIYVKSHNLCSDQVNEL